MDGDEEKLWKRHGDDVSKWMLGYGGEVEGGRVTRLDWGGEGLSGIIPAEIETLSGLTVLNLRKNNLSGELPRELGNLTSLTNLYIYNNYFSGAVPSSLAKLINRSSVCLGENTFTTDAPCFTIYNDKERVQAYLATLKSKSQRIC